ncbi:MAG TPA: aminotransferase class I/II-fold pyridoxal phosphate-dependent enzyme, partial [Bacteroidota bacterium]|nr:aminotransferase class I/II-fold pyridoxal phosphate-dependent enzyme [Bacteroidota bacterium]
KIIYCNIGNPQALKQRPLTFLRQLLSLVEYPELLGHPETLTLYPRDIIERAKTILERHPHGTGAYSQSPGIPFIRQAVADFISRRDSVPADKEHVILTDGASKGAQAVMTALLRSPADGFMIPIPQYPLYSASLALYGGRQIGYYLDELHGWELDEAVLSECARKAKSSGIQPVGIVVINPGNPTGAVLSEENIRMIVRFAREHKLAIIADEVYQENVYDSADKFYSFARIMWEMNEKEVSLFSLHSISKGFLGECGHRGGYLEIRNVPDDVLAQFIKLQSISLCANIAGQIATYMMVAPPVPGDQSYPLYEQERAAVLGDLKAKAEILGRGINSIRGMSVDIPRGAMYAFVRFELPGLEEKSPLAGGERRKLEEERDEEYCLALLEQTGICVVPGSGFGQIPGTMHFRTTFLPPRDEIEQLVTKLKEFHERYAKELAEA